jgi:hypothetical protein
VILIHPPITKPSEPPAGIARLSGTLAAHGVPHSLLDANLEGMLHLIRGAHSCSDTWTKRACRNVLHNLTLLKRREGYAAFGRYQRAVADTNRLLEKAAGGRFRLSLADYADHDLSPQRSSDLLEAAEHPERNPFYPYFSARLRQIMADSQTDTVGISLSYLSQALCSFAIAGFLRREFPRLRIILGGSLVTSWMGSPFWRMPFAGLIDTMVRGSGEGPLLALLGVNLNQRAVFSFNGFSLDDYLAPGFIMPYATSAGCYWRRCSFCPEKTEGSSYCPTRPNAALSEMNALTGRYRPALLHVIDNALSPAMLSSIIEAPIGVPWYGFARITPHLADDDFVLALRQSGCVMLKVGLESGDQAVLDALDKGIKLGTASQALKKLKGAGIGTYVYLLFGTPPEDSTTARKTLEFTATHRDFIDFLNIAIFNLPINSNEAADLELRNFYEGDLSLYADFVHPHGFGRREVRAFLDKEFRRHPAIRQILLRQPPLFTSNHAPFFIPDGSGSTRISAPASAPGSRRL